MNKKDVSMQLYTTRHFQPYEPILKFLSDSGIVNIELFGLESMNTNEFKSMMDQVNITSKSTHVGFESLNDASNIIDRANTMNIKHIIVPAPPARKDAEFKNTFDMNEEEWMDFGKKLSSHVSIFEDAGLTLGYHNHSYEFNILPSGKYPIEYILDENENLKFEIDLGWTTAGNANPLEWISKYKNKIIACHLKDFYSEEDMLNHDNQSAIGDGFINWKDLLFKISETPCEVVAIEHDDPKDYKIYITKSLEYLSKI